MLISNCHVPIIYVYIRWIYVYIRWIYVYIRWIYVYIRWIYVYIRWIYVNIRWIYVYIRWIYVYIRWIYVYIRWIYVYILALMTNFILIFYPNGTPYRYSSVDTATELVLSIGPGHICLSWTSRKHIAWFPSTQRIGPSWGCIGKGLLRGYPSLSFSLQSAPKIFTALADALHWIMASRGIQKNDSLSG